METLLCPLSQKSHSNVAKYAGRRIISVSPAYADEARLAASPVTASPNSLGIEWQARSHSPVQVWRVQWRVSAIMHLSGISRTPPSPFGEICCHFMTNLLRFEVLA